MATSRIGVGLAVVNRLLYVVGGFDGVSRLSTVERYHPEKDEWRLVAPMSVTRSGAGKHNICWTRHLFVGCVTLLLATLCIYLYFLYIYLFINWSVKRHKVVTSEAPFLPRDGRNHLRYSLHLPTEGWPGWVDLSSLDKYQDSRPAKGRHQALYWPRST